MSESLDVVATYGLSNAGVRARAVEFADRLGLPWNLTSYFPGNTAGLRAFLRTPTRALRSELQMRQLSKRRPSRILIRKEASPLGAGDLEVELLRCAERGIYDLDDALYADVRSTWFEYFFSKGRKAQRAARAADVVIAGNDYIADWATSWAEAVRVVPTCVEVARYAPKTDFRVGEAPRIVWLGTSSGERYLASIESALRRLHRQTGATVTIVGNGRPSLGELESMIVRVPWSLDGVHRHLKDYDIGIMPLPDSSYERGKCAYKLLEYGAARLPAVASPVGVNGAVVQAAGAPAPNSVDDWYDSLHSVLTAGPERREELGRRLREIVAADYSFDRWLPEWQQAVQV